MSPLVEEIDDAAARLLDAAAAAGARLEAFDAAVQDGVGVVEGEVVAAQGEDGGAAGGHDGDSSGCRNGSGNCCQAVW